MTKRRAKQLVGKLDENAAQAVIAAILALRNSRYSSSVSIKIVSATNQND